MMSEMRDESVLLKRLSSGVSSVLYVAPRVWLGRGANSTKRFHSP